VDKVVKGHLKGLTKFSLSTFQKTGETLGYAKIASMKQYHHKMTTTKSKEKEARSTFRQMAILQPRWKP
jgi:hypothetical protein